ncbi:FAD binding domain-containing protein [Mycena floridula]|nr:FAD binding domain-containing protein [Mycena floridula]
MLRSTVLLILAFNTFSSSASSGVPAFVYQPDGIAWTPSDDTLNSGKVSADKEIFWRSLNKTLDGRLLPATPFAFPCSRSNGPACSQVQKMYTDEVFRSTTPFGYIQTQWETCQATGEQCLLDADDPSNLEPIRPPRTCARGSVAEYYIDVRSAHDVIAAFDFSRQTKIPLVIKNTGHDYIGRSSAPNSLALWTHNLKNISFNPEFVPDQCGKHEAKPGMTLGAGVQWIEAYSYAEEHNVTIVGGTDRSVGASGGWLQGGGHSLLSNTMGLGVDRVLEFQVVTPDGKIRTANKCQNQDLFYALRGGGGGTFGVVLSSTHLVSPRVTIQAVIVTFPAGNTTLTRELWSTMAQYGLTWAADGWGGLSKAETAVFVNPKLNKTAAATSMAPLIEGLGRHANVHVSVLEFPSFGTFFKVFSTAFVAKVGQNLALTSRLIPKSLFPSNTSISPAKLQTQLVDALIKADTEAPGLLILMTAPASFPGDGTTSVTDAWRHSLWHVTAVSTWNWNATRVEKRAAYDKASGAIDWLRKITRDQPAAYLNEADVYEPNHEVSFWGTKYPQLLSIKKKYDKDHLLDCWHCVGWQPKSPRYSCYI